MNQKNTTDVNEKMRLALTIDNKFTPQSIKSLARQSLRRANDKSDYIIYFTMLEKNPDTFTQDFS